MELKRPSSDTDSHWGGFTRDPKLLPLEDLEKDGYILQEREDQRGKYWEIIKAAQGAK